MLHRAFEQPFELADLEPFVALLGGHLPSHRRGRRRLPRGARLRGGRRGKRQQCRGNCCSGHKHKPPYRFNDT